jgi:hypothetical protein
VQEHGLNLPRHRAGRGSSTLPHHGAWRGKTALPRLSFTKTSMAVGGPEAKIERRGCFVFPRRRAWRGTAPLVMSPEELRVTSSAAPHRTARRGNVAAPLRMARQVRVAAPPVQLESWPRERTGFCKT